jgi:PHD/YefM family antitoxin component YafN of YafNO toxin-antitoxin module
MSIKYLEAYKEAYSKYIEYAVGVHNEHQLFIKNIGRESGKAIRNNLRAMMLLERELIKLSNAAHREHLASIAEERKRRREIRAKDSRKYIPETKKGGKEWKQQPKSNNNTKTS